MFDLIEWAPFITVGIMIGAFLFFLLIFYFIIKWFENLWSKW